MPEYDAFGREIGQDPLASLRSATNPAPPREEPAARPEPVENEPVETASPPPHLAAWAGARPAEPEAAPAGEPPRISPPPRIEFVRPRRRRRGLAGLLIVGAVLGGLGLAINAAVETGSDIIDQIAPEEAEPPPTGLQARSWLREENVTSALATLQSADLGRPIQLRIAPDRIDATLLKGDQIHVVQLTSDGELKDFGSSTGSGPAIPFKTIDPAAPEKLVRRGANGKHPAGSIDYVLVNPGPPVNVAAYFKGGRIVIGDRHGRPQRVI